MINYILFGLLGVAGIINTILVYISFHLLMRAPHFPFDDTNRFNRLRVFFWSYKRPYLFNSLGYGRIRLVWEALHHEEKFGDLFEWTKHDEWENINQKKTD